MAGTLIVFAGLISWYGVTALSDKKEQRENNAAVADANNQSDNAVANGTSLLATDDRILLTPETIAQYQKDENGAPICDAGFVTDPATTTARYEDPVGRFEIELPFNPDWGTADYRIASFDELSRPIDDGTGDVKSSAQFGFMAAGEGCGWYRSNFISVREQRSFAEIQDWATNESGGVPNLLPRKTTVGDLEVAEYNLGALCGSPTVEVIGDDFNVVIQQICGHDEIEKDQTALRKILESLAFL